MVTNYDNCIPVRMTNLSTKPQVIKKGQRIGSARLIDQRNYAKPQELYDTAQHECHINHMSVHDETNTRHVENYLSASKLTKQQKQQVQKLVNYLSDYFVDPKEKKLGYTELVTHKIRLLNQMQNQYDDFVIVKVMS